MFYPYVAAPGKIEAEMSGPRPVELKRDVLIFLTEHSMPQIYLLVHFNKSVSISLNSRFFELDLQNGSF